MFVSKLSKETGESITRKDLVDGACVLYECNGRTYDVTIRTDKGAGVKQLQGTTEIQTCPVIIFVC